MPMLAALFFLVFLTLAGAIVYTASHILDGKPHLLLLWGIVGTEYRDALDVSESAKPHNILNQTESPTYTRSWWTSERLFQLERRAIFSKTWLYVTHASRFQKPGDYRTFEVAGFSIIIILGKDGQLRAFHNVCRHRAYAITKKNCGSSIVLGCRYHGWSYDTKGRLIKAPEFENVLDFDKDENGLWEVKSETRRGLVFVNLQTKDLSADEQIENILGNTIATNMEKMSWLAEWRFEGNFNWKLAVQVLASKKHSEEYSGSWWSAFPSSIFHIFPNRDPCKVISQAAIIRYFKSGYIVTMRVLPLARDRSAIDCNLYRDHPRRRFKQEAIQAIESSISEEVENIKRKQKQLLTKEISDRRECSASHKLS
ncbi:Rieske [2Fe-2S] iron-sulfur domain-containing protein [Bisporella sp. PMI_857]|nr:Rieske [2Fe-2S] iron-sulfur domain-containing protein [Bisporella sp. PMI_857]